MSFTTDYRRYPIRLYSMHDLDLLTLYNNDKKFKKKVVKILSDYAKGIKPSYSLKGINITDKGAVIDNEIALKTQRINLNINPKKYPEVINLLISVRFRYRGDFVKCLVKNALPFPVTQLYFEEFNEVELITDKALFNEDNKELKKKEVIKAKKKEKKITEKPIINNSKKAEEIEVVKEEVHNDYKIMDDTDLDTYKSDDGYSDLLDNLIENY